MSVSVQQVVILAAGLGSRLRKDDRDYLKPLYPLRGRPLIAYVMEAFARQHVTDFHVVVGFEREELVPGLRESLPNGARLQIVDNPDYKLSNGISLLKAKDSVQGRFYLSMSDHLFAPEMIATLTKGAANPNHLYLAVDRKIDSIFDMDDATKVRTKNDHIIEINKQLDSFDAIDTGLFVCPADIFGYLQVAADKKGDCSLSDGVQAMATDGKAQAVDIGDSFWQDVDTPEMYEHAANLLTSYEKTNRIWLD